MPKTTEEILCQFKSFEMLKMTKGYLDRIEITKQVWYSEAELQEALRKQKEELTRISVSPNAEKDVREFFKEELRKQAEEIFKELEQCKPILEEGKSYEMWDTCYPLAFIRLIELKQKFLGEKE